MKRFVVLAVLAFVSCHSSPGAGKALEHEGEPTGLGAWEPPAPEKEHAWLQQLVGVWESTAEMTMAPDQPPVETQGTERTRSLGGFWVVSDIEGTMPGGGTMSAILTLGFDPERKEFVGTWVDSVTSHMWIYEGSLDPTGRILTLETEGPDFEDPSKQARFRDVIELVDEDHKVMRSSLLGEDGKWTSFMTVQFQRKG